MTHVFLLFLGEHKNAYAMVITLRYTLLAINFSSIFSLLIDQRFLSINDTVKDKFSDSTCVYSIFSKGNFNSREDTS